MTSPIERFRNLDRAQQVLASVGLVAIVAVVVLVPLLAFGGDGEAEPTTTTTSAPTTTTTLPPPLPLTGEPDFDGVADRPAISVKIGNNPEARPQQGLDVADIVYEEEVEGRVTRFLTVFHSDASSRVGPIRSVRLMDALIARPLGGMFVYSGGGNVPERINRLDEAGLKSFNETALDTVGARVLDPDHGNGLRPNILFVEPEVLWEANAGLAPPPAMFSFLGEGGRFGGEPVTEVRVPVGGSGFNPVWRWNDDDGVWERFLGGEPFEAKSGEQVAFENLVVQFVEVSGEESLVVGDGEAVVLSDGQMIRGRWERPDPDQPARYLDEAGNEIELTPGRTWVHLPRAGGTVEVTQPSS